MSHFRKRIALLAAAVLIFVGVSALNNDRSSAQEENSLVYLEKATWTTLYPPSVGFYPNGGIANNIFDRLLYQDPETLELHPWIAESWESNEDDTIYTFHIRQGVTYSDGTILDAANVVKNFDTFGRGDKDRKLTTSEQINNYDRGEVVDEYTARFYFTAPSPGFAQATSTMNAGLLSNATLDKTLDQFGPGNATTIIGSGPFIITDEEIGHSLTLTARQDYDWAPPLQTHTGPALVDKIEIIVAPETSVRVGALVAGQGDIARDIDAPEEKHLINNGLKILAASTRGMNNSLNFRFRDSRLSDINVRQAIVHGVDREDIVTTLFSESYPIATSPLAKQALGYKDVSAAYTYDPELSKKLLDEAGWVPGPDGIREKDGQRLSFNINYALVQPRSREVLTKVQEHLARIGIEINIYPGDNAAQNAAVKDIEKIQIMHTMVGRAEYDNIKSHLYSANRNSLLNKLPDGSIGDQHLEDLLASISTTVDPAQREAIAHEIQDYLVEQSYTLPLFEEPQVFGYQSYVHDFQTEAVGRPWFYNVWVSKG